MHSLAGSLNPWDLLLVIAISVQATILAYLQQPRWKAFVLSLPVPFTLMVLAAAHPVDVTNALGLFLLLLFTQRSALAELRVTCADHPGDLPRSPGVLCAGFFGGPDSCLKQMLRFG